MELIYRFSKNNQNVTNVHTEPIRLVRHGEPNLLTEPHWTEFVNSWKLNKWKSSVRRGSMRLGAVKFPKIRLGSPQCGSISFSSKFGAHQAIRRTGSVRIFGALHLDYFYCSSFSWKWLRCNMTRWKCKTHHKSINSGKNFQKELVICQFWFDSNLKFLRMRIPDHWLKPTQIFKTGSTMLTNLPLKCVCPCRVGVKVTESTFASPPSWRWCSKAAQHLPCWSRASTSSCSGSHCWMRKWMKIL